MAAVAAEVGTRAAQKLDNVIERLGIGRFHYLAAMVCGLANAADAVELLCISFILPELPQAVSNQEKSALNAAVFLGMLVGGVVAGVASDRLGRKPMLLSSLAVNAAFGLLSVLSPSWPWLAACRVVAGMGVGGSIPGVFGLFTEYLPVQSRGFFISIVAWWWMIGTYCIACFCVRTVPHVHKQRIFHLQTHASPPAREWGSDYPIYMRVSLSIPCPVCLQARCSLRAPHGS